VLEEILFEGEDDLASPAPLPRVVCVVFFPLLSLYRGTSHIRIHRPLGPYRRPIRKRTPIGRYRKPISKILRGYKGGRHFLMGEVAMCHTVENPFIKSQLASSFGGHAGHEPQGPSEGTEAMRLVFRSVSSYFGYRGTSLIKKHLPLGAYRRPMPRVLWGS
jgi:hypothetical protein